MKSRGNSPKMQRNTSPRLALEPRIVFDAAIGATAADAFDRHADGSEYVPPATNQATTSQPTRDARADAAKPVDLRAREMPKDSKESTESTKSTESKEPTQVPDGKGSLVKSPLVGDAPRVASASTEIIFVDASVKDLLPFLAGRSGEVVVLQAGRDGVAQIAAALAGRTGINAIHILSHGGVGELYLGNATLSLNSMVGDYADELAAIKASLATNADILVYGCNFGEGELGALATEALARLTGADVASSTDVTGNAAKGGNWVLERQTGSIEAKSALDEEGQAQFDGTFTLLVAGSAPVITAGPNSTNVGGVLTPKTAPPGNVVGSTAVWSSVATGTFGTYTGAIDLKATITSVAASDINDTVTFTTQDSSASILIGAGPTIGTDGAIISVHWELVQAGTLIPVVTSFAFTVGDIDGVSPTSPRESVAASTGNGLTSYTVETAPGSDIAVTNIGTQVKAVGTADELASPPLSISSIRFNWVNVSSVDFVYTVSPNSVTAQARFGMLGNDSIVFTTPSITPLGIDLDGNNSSGATGNDFKNTFYLGGSPIPVVDADISFSLAPPTFASGTVTLAGAQPGDQFVVGTLPAGITAVIDNVTAGGISVTFTGAATPADYILALRAVSFNNTLGAPVLTDRSIVVQLSDGSALTNAPVATIVVTPNKPPVNTLPATYVAIEDVIGGVSLAGLSISDANAGAAEIMTVKLSVASGSGTITGVAPTGGTVADRKSVV